MAAYRYNETQNMFGSPIAKAFYGVCVLGAYASVTVWSNGSKLDGLWEMWVEANPIDAGGDDSEEKNAKDSSVTEKTTAKEDNAAKEPDSTEIRISMPGIVRFLRTFLFSPTAPWTTLFGTSFILLYMLTTLIMPSDTGDESATSLPTPSCEMLSNQTLNSLMAFLVMTASTVTLRSFLSKATNLPAGRVPHWMRFAFKTLVTPLATWYALAQTIHSVVFAGKMPGAPVTSTIYDLTCLCNVHVRVRNPDKSTPKASFIERSAEVDDTEGKQEEEEEELTWIPLSSINPSHTTTIPRHGRSNKMFSGWGLCAVNAGFRYWFFTSFLGSSHVGHAHGMNVIDIATLIIAISSLAPLLQTAIFVGLKRDVILTRPSSSPDEEEADDDQIDGNEDAGRCENTCCHLCHPPTSISPLKASCAAFFTPITPSLRTMLFASAAGYVQYCFLYPIPPVEMFDDEGERVLPGFWRWEVVYDLFKSLATIVLWVKVLGVMFAVVQVAREGGMRGFERILRGEYVTEMVEGGDGKTTETKTGEKKEFDGLDTDLEDDRSDENSSVSMPASRLRFWTVVYFLIGICAMGFILLAMVQLLPYITKASLWQAVAIWQHISDVGSCI